MRSVLLVGVGPIDNAQQLDWAGAEAARRHAAVRLVHAVKRPGRGEGSRWADMRAEAARGLLAAAADRIATHAPDVAVDTAVAVGSSAADALRAHSADAALIVLGSRGRTALGDVIAGATALTLVKRAPCELVVVRRDQSVSPGPAAGRVVVGVDGSDLSLQAVEFAFHQASLCGVGLLAVHAWSPPMVLGQGRPLYGHSAERERLRQQQLHTAWLSTSLAGCRECYPDVTAHQDLVERHPGEAPGRPLPRR